MARDAVLFVRVTEDMKTALERAAEAEDLKVAQLLRRIIREWLHRHPPPRTDDQLTKP
jgi:hypothetical protein